MYLVIDAVALEPSMRSRVSRNILFGTSASSSRSSLALGGVERRSDAKSEHAAFAASMAPWYIYWFLHEKF